MGDFSAQWLALREPVDHASRNVVVQQAMLSWLRQKHGSALAELQILDLGCGTGSNLRAIAPLLGQTQQWTLLDYAPQLLQAAKASLMAWADQVLSADQYRLSLLKSGQTIDVSFALADLNIDSAHWLAQGFDLVTASALFDLVSAHWIDAFCRQLRAPLYAVLSYDGQMDWNPAHPLDAQVVAAFENHQQQDKGFGLALGPAANSYLLQSLASHGFSTDTGKSPWLIEAIPGEFYRLLLEGIEQAVRQTGRCEPTALRVWYEARLNAQACAVGHDDLFAWPTDSANC